MEEQPQEEQAQEEPQKQEAEESDPFVDEIKLNQLEQLEEFRAEFAGKVQEMADIIERQAQLTRELGQMAAHLPVEWEHEMLPPIQEMIGIDASSAEFHYRFARFIRSSEVALSKVRSVIENFKHTPMEEVSQAVHDSLEKQAIKKMAEQEDQKVVDILGGLEGLSEDERDAEIRKRVATKLRRKDGGDHTNLEEEGIETTTVEDE